MKRPEVLRRVAILALLGAVYAVLLSRFDLRLLLADTMLTGGDSASWLQPLETLRDEYLPRLRLFGYSHSNFFGYLEGQHYFPLPFLVPALLGYVIPLTIALKLATMAGALALPLTCFLGLRSFTKDAWIGVAGAGASLLFLFNESYTMFGGNFLSTFAGEFAYSWAIALLPLFIASAWRDHAEGGWSPRSGLLLGAIGLCHFFVFMVAFFLPFFFAFRRAHLAGTKDGSEARVTQRATRGLPLDGLLTGIAPGVAPGALVLRIPLTYLVALCLMAFWLLPMLATRTWAQSISMIWRFQDFPDFARQTLLPVWAGAAALALMVALPKARPTRGRNTSRRRGVPARESLPDVPGLNPLQGVPRRAAFLLYGLGASAFLFLAATVLEVPDIRFVPPALIISLFSAALFAAEPSRRGVLPTGAAGGQRRTALPLRPILATLVLAASCVGAVFMARNAPAWFAWNYSGYEAKAKWPNLAGIAEAYRGGIMDGRILWEKQNQYDNADFGSERGFENLMHFTGRPSAEGIHYGSSFMARATTWLQSAYSLNPVDPEADRLYSVVDPDSLPLRFTQANAHHIIAYSPEIKAAFSALPEFRLDREFGKFAVFEYLDFPGSYVELVDPRALSVVRDSTGGFKTDFYRFFRDYELVRRPFVPQSFTDAGLESRIASRYSSYEELYMRAKGAGDWLSYAASPGLAPVTEESVDAFTISFTTANPGQPHVIRASYAPGWTSTGGERIYPVSPGFMLLWPRGNEVRLEYRRTGTEWAGLALSLLVLPAILLCSPALGKLRLQAYRPLFALAFALFFSAMGAFAILSRSGTAPMKAAIERARTLDLSDPRARAEAASLVEPYAKPVYLERYDNRVIFDAYRIQAQILSRTGNAGKAAVIYTMLRDRFPHARAIQDGVANLVGD